MRIARLDLTAFGCFTDRQLVFEEISPDFHLVYGDNEAGKTTALTAVRELLYGIHPQTPYDFRHRYGEMQIGACLCLADGEACELIRYKRRKNSLMDASGRPYEDSNLRRMLASMEQEQFERVFALTHEDLVVGGRQIVDGEGDVGEALFAAGLGGVRLNQLRRSLKQRSEDIFTARARTRALNEKLGQIQDLDRQIRDLRLSGNQWEQERRELDRERLELRKLTARREELRQQSLKLQRLKRNIPSLSRLRELARQLAELGEVVALPDDFDDRRRDAEQQLGEAGRRLEELKRRIEQTARQVEEIEIPEDLLQRRDEIARLYERLGAYQAGQEDVVKRRTERDTQTSRLVDLAGRLPGKRDVQSAVDTIPDVATRTAIEGLADEKGGLDEKLRSAREELGATNERVETFNADLAEAPEGMDTSSLLRAVREVRGTDGIDERLEKCEDELTTERQAAERQLAQLPLWDGDLEEALTLELPLKGTVNEFAKRFRDLDGKRERLGERAAELDERESAIRRELREIELAGRVPLEADVTAAREVRDGGWLLIKRRFLLEEDVDLGGYAPQGDAGAVYEEQVQAADDTVDRLRNESERALRRAQLEAELEELQTRRADMAKDVGQCEEQGERFRSEWREKWACVGIEPLGPEEMLEWIDAVGNVRAAAGAVVGLETDRDALQAQVTDACERLGAELVALGEDIDEAASLAGLKARADQVTQREQEARSAREQLVRDLERARSDKQKRALAVDSAESALEDWTERWLQATGPLELGESPTVGQAREVLGVFDELHEVHRAADGLERRIKGIERDARQFEDEVGDLVHNVATDLAEVGAADAMRELQARLATAREDRTRLEQLTKSIGGYEADVKGANETQEQARQELTALCELAQRDVDGLAEAWKRHCEHRSLSEQIAQVTEQLEQDGNGLLLADLKAEAEGQDRDRVSAQLETASEEAQALDEQHDEKSRSLAVLEAEFKSKDGGDEAAACAEQRQRLIASVRDETERYLTLAVARQLLAQAIESFRAENQDSMLARAGDLFARMTDGSFSGLDMEWREADMPVLVGLRGDDGAGVTVDGMSDGTCDQLYLAFRLAHIERLHKQSGPLPLILDDILIRFDDNRARNTLAVLGEVGQDNQVIFFTHHRRLQQLAEEALGEGRYRVHELNG